MTASKPSKSRYVSAEDVIADVRWVAREHGYAVGLHGSLRSNRDIDLIACPWTSRARAMSSLVKAVLALPYLTPNPNMKLPVRKAHGRRGWALLIKWRKDDCPAYIDLSVMPRV
jgi:hypothetical protein